MERDSVKTNANSGNNPSSRDRERGDGSLLRSSSQTTTSDFVLQWGNRKRLRCMKVQVKDDSLAPSHRTTARVDRRVVRADKDPNQAANHNQNGNGYLNLRQRPCSPPPPPPQRVLRNTENSSAMRGQSNGGLRGFSSPDRGAHDKRGGGAHSNHHNNTNNHTNHHHQQHNEGNKSAASSETAHDSKKGGGSSSGSGELVAPPVWPPKFLIALTNKEKEEDFIVFKGSKLPHRPKKRAKLVQKTVNLVCPGGWLCDLTIERYEVREKKISKKRPRGLKAMGNMVESDSE